MNLLPNKPHVCIGLSGGVDSCVGADLLKRQGFKVTGVYIKSWDEKEETGYCNGEQDYKDAKSVADSLGIEFHQVDLVKDYWNRVFVNFLDQYRKGFTPNPDVFCNREIKFDAFVDFTKEVVGTDMIATGHYAKLEYNKDDENGIPKLMIPKDKDKDQTYFLSMTQGEKFKRVIFPLSDILKQDVRSHTELYFNEISKKTSSRGICFIGKRPLPEFLSQYIDIKEGYYLDVTSSYQFEQKHKGAICYTKGQKANLHSLPEKYFVVATDIKNNIVFVCPQSKVSQYLTTTSMTVNKFNWINGIPEDLANGKPMEFRARVLHRGDLHKCTVTKKNQAELDNIVDQTFTVEFHEPITQSGAPGQICCLYDSITDVCYGGSVITDVHTLKHPLDNEIYVPHWVKIKR
eukprot:gene4790-5975_t